MEAIRRDGWKHVAVAAMSAFAALAAFATAPAALIREQAPASSGSTQAAAGTVNRIRVSGRIKLGYRVDAAPFSFKTDAGNAGGYSAAVCLKVVEGVESGLGLNRLMVEWIPVTLDERFQKLQTGEIDLHCGADTVTLERRIQVAFSIPIFPGGIAALVRSDAPPRLQEVLAGRGEVFRPTWRATAGQVLHSRGFSVVAGTTAAAWLTERIGDLKVVATVTPVAGYEEGIERVLNRKSDVLFGERAILLNAAARARAPGELRIVDRQFTYEPLALAMGRNDDDFRLLVDRALSQLYRSGEIGALYSTAFGEPGEEAITFFRWNALPD